MHRFVLEFVDGLQRMRSRALMKINQAEEEDVLIVKTVRHRPKIELAFLTIHISKGYRHYDASDILKLKFFGTG